MNHNLQIYQSSAGSGKTYTLALNFISLSLKGGSYGYKDYYRNILAITFTNKAASEMKDRVLHYLDVLAKRQDVDGILEWLESSTSFDQETIFQRAAVVHKHILHNYANLGISTIDRFIYKIVRTFATDLGLSNNFDIEMDNYKIIQPVVALLLSRISYSGGALSSTLLNFAIEKAEDGKSINIEHDLEVFSQAIFNENFDQYHSGEILKVDACIQIKEFLQKDKQRLKLEVYNLSSRVSLFFEEESLEKDFFIRGTFYNHFTNKISSNDDKKWMPTDTLLENIANDKWYPSAQENSIKEKIDFLKPQLVNFMDELIDLLEEYYSLRAVLQNIYSITVLNEIILELRRFKKENNVEQISEFNKRIHNIVTKQPSSFIYERLGERYNHYLIDEFQDTSLLQWQNILPLITASLDEGKSMLVGDGKQSIYRWRGGEVEQFSRLPYIFKGDHLIFKKEWESKLKHHYKDNYLKANYRSRRNVIEFNNHFFENIKELLSNSLRKIYDNLSQDSKQAKEGGYIHIELFGDKGNDFKTLILQKIVSEVRKITSVNDYSYKDIAILCNSSRSVSLVSEYLLENNIPVTSKEGLLLSSSNKVNTVISILRYLQNQSDDIAKVIIVEYLWRGCLNTESLYKLHLEIKSNQGFLSVLNRANIYINLHKLLEEPLYELVEQIIRSFNIEEDIYLIFFLDMVLNYSEKEGGSLSGFLGFWEERIHKESIVIPEDTNAVRVMTIHKSKGLAFNVVMIPFNWEDRKKTQDIWVDTSKYFNKQLKAALIASNEQLKVSYFKDNYLKEKEMSLLDSINKLYVAMTRARERLYVFSKTLPSILSNYEKKQNLNSFLYKYNHDFPLIIGDSEMIHETKIDVMHSFPVKRRNKLNWRDIISFKHSAEEIWDVQTQNNKRDWGKLLHLVLSKISYANEKERVINEMYNLGKFAKEDYQKLQKVIRDLLMHPEVRVFFTNEWDVKNEKEILMNNGKTYIPDRLLFSKNKDRVVIIDYKTGQESDKHKHQISEYANVLNLMFKTNVESILIYTSPTIKVVKI